MVARCYPAILAALLAAAASAQTFTIQIETEDGRSQFRIGEAVPLQLKCEAPGAPDSQSPGQPGWMLSITSQGRTVLGLGRDRFSATPTEGTRDLWEYRLHGGIGYSGPGGIRVGPQPVTIHVDLNQWVRFERPGHYSVQAIFHAAGPARQDAEAVSNAIAIDIVAADPAWQRDELVRDTATLRFMEGRPDSAAFEARMRAANQIAFLDTPDAVREMARGLGALDIQTAQVFADGLRASVHPREAVAALREFLASPDIPVPDIFLRTLAALDSPLREPQSALADVVERKQGAARAISLKTLIDDLAPAGVPAKLRSEIAAAFPELPCLQQLDLLKERWAAIECPEMIPVLRHIYETAPQPRYPENELLAAAVERLYALDTARTRAMLLDEMKRPEPRLPYRTLAMLPDPTLPELDALLLDHLRKNGGRPVEELIARYATVSILDGVKNYYRERDVETRSRVTANVNIVAPVCEPPLLGYFLRVDSAAGEKMFRQVLAERSYPMGRCWLGVIGQTAVYNTSPAWEKVATDALQDPSVPVKADAVNALARSGSPASKPAIFEAFRYWHEWWQSRGDPNDLNLQLEQAFAQAVMHSRNWTSTAGELATARDLCITAGCKS